MQLLNWVTADTLATALLVSALLSVIVSFVAVRIHSENFGAVFFTVLAFSLLGFITGEVTANSRESAVGAVLPGVLTLLGSVAAYTISTRGIKQQSGISAILICFSLTFLVGAIFGALVRQEYELALQSPSWLVQRELAAQQPNLPVEIQRLEDYIQMLKMRKDYADAEKLDLSHFEISFEKPPSERKETAKRGEVAPVTAK
ncbi:MAG: hypothetical protein JOZ84_03025 [Methylobacteriaceae bacterium]|nr:hypothetical protein [Methylobacteriaceae bacterium]